ncbi:SIMPL domain-containing protein [candidate division WWE3 bacterium]|nr:SIMPL domain-containing protein [candidate division WWE3 bacterium]
MKDQTAGVAFFTLKALVVVVVILLSLRLLGSVPLSLNTKQLDKDTTFFVSAEGKTYVKPDIAAVSLSINTNAQTASAAQKQANEAINKVTAELKKFGVGEDAIKTTSYNIYPVYGETPGRISSYNASVSVRVKERDLDKVNSIIDSATANGANEVSGVTFDVENRDQAVDQARKEAISKAKEKAQKIANEAGIRLGRIINISESSTPQYFEGKFMDVGLSGGGGETDIQPGQTEIVINVTLSYETL